MASSSLAGYNPFVYLVCDLASGSILGELPIRGVSFGKILNGVGQFQGSIDLADPLFQNVDPLNLTKPGRTALFVDYNGALVWGGVLWSRSYQFQDGSRTVGLTASDMWSYFASRVQATDYTAPPFSGITGPNVNMTIWDAVSSGSTWDPVLVATQVVYDAVSVAFGRILGGVAIAGNGLPIVSATGSVSTTAYTSSASATPAGSYVNVTYPYSSLQTVDTIIAQLAQLGLTVGFDRGLDVAYSAGSLSVPVGTVNFSYPRRGQTVANNNLFVDLSTAYSYQFPEDATQMANTIYETGSAGAISVSVNTSPTTQGYPLTETVKSRSNITTANIGQLLSNIGLSDLFIYSYPPVVPQVTIDLFSNSPALGQFIEGDDIQVYIPATDGVGNQWDPRFPNGMNLEWRITAWTATVNDEGTSTLQLTLAEPPSTSISGSPI